MSGTSRTINFLLSSEFEDGQSAGSITPSDMRDLIQTFAQLTYAAQPITQYWVSTTGSDSNPGTFASPFLTAGKAVSTATVSGTVVYFRGGTYTLGSSVSPSASNNGVTFMAWPGETPIFDGNGTVDPLWNCNNVVGMTINGLQIQNGPQSTGFYYGGVHMFQCYGCNIIGNYFTNLFKGIYLDSASWNTISGNKMFNISRATGNTNPGGGIYGGNCNNNLIQNNIIDTTASLNGGTGTNSAGVWIGNGSGNKILNNIVRNCIGSAIVLETISTSGSIAGNVIQYNYCPNNITNVTSSDCGVIYVYNGSLQLNNNVLIDNNFAECLQTSTSVESVGIYLDNYTSGVTVTNNVVSAICSFGLLIHGGQNNLFRNNIFNMGAITSANCGAGLLQGLAGFTGASMVNNQITGNIIYSTAASAPGAVWQGLSTPVATITSNFYYNTNAQTMTNNSGGVSDVNAITAANPQFVNPTTSTGTPPISYDMDANNVPGFDGFVPINQALWGLQGNFIHWPLSWS